MRGVPFSNTGMEKSISDPSIPGSEPRMFQAQLYKKRFQDWGEIENGKRERTKKKVCNSAGKKNPLGRGKEKKVEFFTRLS